MSETVIMNFRGIPLKTARQFKSVTAALGMTQQAAVVVLLQAAVDGSVDLARLAKKQRE